MGYNHFDERKVPIRNIAFSVGNPKGLLATLDSIDFELPQTIHSLAAAGEPLGKGGHKISVVELDAQLKKCEMRVEQRLQLKSALIRQGLL
jgi:hypothetical protein